jgi:cysteinyl-tRNA synthetase
MSKSLGNLVTIKQALEKYSPDAIRIFVLSSHYRSPLTYSEEGLEAAGGGAERLLRVISKDDPTGGVGEALNAESYRKQFIEAMDDDFNTPQALAVLFDLAREINQVADSGLSFLKAQSILSELARNILGLKLGFKPPVQTIELKPVVAKTSVASPTLILGANPTPELEERVNRLVEERLRCRKAKQWQQADEIRARLAELGIVLEDTPQRTKRIWKRTPSVETLDKLLAEFGITLEDTPKGTVRKRKK